jgi:hypothetical protein
MSALRRVVAGVACLTLSALAQTTVTGGGRGLQGVDGGVRIISAGFGPFAERGEPPSPPIYIATGFSSRGFGAESVTHRYFRDDARHVFFGYDLLLQPGRQGDTYQASFFELGMGLLDMPLGRPGFANPAEWKKVPLPAYPPPQEVHGGDTVSIVVWVNPDTGQKLVDDIHIQPPAQNLRVTGSTVRMPSLNGSLSGAAFTVPTFSGTARDFSAADAEMRLAQPRVKVNGPDVQDTNTRIETGSLVWFYLPHRGRYVLSLAPRPELGFAKAGEVRGGAATFKDGKDEFTLECRTSIAPGSAPYILYVLHDPEWEPTSQGQVGRLQIGTVAPGEIASLMKK